MPIPVMPWKMAVFVFVLLASMFIAFAAFAQDGDALVIPWGDWLIQTIDALMPVVSFLILALGAWVVALLPPWFRAIAGAQLQKQINEVLEKAVLSAVAQTKGAIVGKQLTVPVSNEVLKRAAEYALELAPDLIGQATKGSADSLMKMILARMEAYGIAPPSYDVDKAPTLPTPAGGKTDFGGMISRGLGGK